MDFNDLRRANLAADAWAGLPEIPPPRPVAICGGGWSLAAPARLEALAAEPTVWAVNGVGRWLRRRHGIRVDGVVLCDPQPGVAPMVAGWSDWAGAAVAYVASDCHPRVFATLRAEGAEMRVWHQVHAGVLTPSGWGGVRGGSAAMLRAPYLALRVGFQAVRLYGFDLSYPPGQAYDLLGRDAGPDAPIIEARLKGCTVLTTALLWQQLQEFDRVLDTFPVSLSNHSGGLAQDLYERHVALRTSLMEG